MSYYDQSGYEIRFAWGREGVDYVGSTSDAIVIVDVLSFSTCVDVALSRRATVFPFGWKDDRAEVFAKENDAILAVGRGQPGYSLSPPSLAQLPLDARIVLPSPNGSSLTVAASQHARTLAGCLRNRSAVASFLNDTEGTVTVVACGERWMPGDTLRPAIEDQIGSGAIIHALTGSKSPEALAAQAVFESVRENLKDTLLACASGRELVEKGYPDDVLFAADLDTSTYVPELREGVYVEGVA